MPVHVRRVRVDIDTNEEHGNQGELVLRNEIEEALVIRGTWDELADLGHLIARITHKHKVLHDEGVI